MLIIFGSVGPASIGIVWCAAVCSRERVFDLSPKPKFTVWSGGATEQPAAQVIRLPNAKCGPARIAGRAIRIAFRLIFCVVCLFLRFPFGFVL